MPTSFATVEVVLLVVREIEGSLIESVSLIVESKFVQEM
jgi:hypothetical protein